MGTLHQQVGMLICPINVCNSFIDFWFFVRSLCLPLDDCQSCTCQRCIAAPCRLSQG